MSQLFTSSTSTFCFDVNQVGGAVAIILHLCVREADRPDKEDFTSAQGSPKQGVTQTRGHRNDLLQNVQKSVGNVWKDGLTYSLTENTCRNRLLNKS